MPGTQAPPSSSNWSYNSDKYRFPWFVPHNKCTLNKTCKGIFIVNKPLWPFRGGKNALQAPKESAHVVAAFRKLSCFLIHFSSPQSLAGRAATAPARLLSVGTGEPARLPHRESAPGGAVFAFVRTSESSSKSQKRASLRGGEMGGLSSTEVDTAWGWPSAPHEG